MAVRTRFQNASSEVNTPAATCDVHWDFDSVKMRLQEFAVEVRGGG
jgi:hypothetical protein